MAVDIFINMGKDIAGETMDKEQSKNKDIDVISWSWGMSQSGTFHSAAGGGAGKVNVQDLSFRKYVDSASGPIMKHCCNGKHVDKMVLLVRKAGGGAKKYITITMNHCMVTSVHTGGSGGEDRLTENVTINFAEVLYEYFVQDAKGDTKPSGKCGWDIAKNIETA